MRLTFALFGHEIASFHIDRDDDTLTSLALSALIERDEEDEDVPFGFSPPGGTPK